MHLFVHSFPGHKYIRDHKKIDQLKQKHEHTSDGFIEVVCGVIRNEAGEYLVVHHSLDNRFVMPGGKVDKGETLKEALNRELKEEIDINITDTKYIGALKEIISNIPYRLHYFSCTIQGEPRIMETNIHSTLKRVGVEAMNTPLGFGLKIENNIFSEIKDIQKTSIDLYFLRTLLHRKDIQKELAEAPYNIPSYLDPQKDYHQVFCLQHKEYFVIPYNATQIPTPHPRSKQTIVFSNQWRDQIGHTHNTIKTEQLTPNSPQIHLGDIIKAVNPHNQQVKYIKITKKEKQERNYVLHDYRETSYNDEGLPVPYFRFTEGNAAYQHGSPVVHRHNIVAVLKHRSEEKFLILKRPQFGRWTFVMWGIDKDENHINAAHREIMEETGYTDIGEGKSIAEEIHSEYYAAHKKENRYAINHAYLFHLQSNAQQSHQREEHEDFVIMWLNPEEVMQQLTGAPMRYIWQKVLEQSD